MITGNESRPAAHPRIPPPYFPARVAPVQGPDGRSSLATHARPPEGAAPRGRGAYAAEAEPADAAPAYRGPAPSGYDSVGFGGASPVSSGYGRAPRAAYVPAAYGEAPRAELDPVYRRQEVAYSGGQAPGTVVIDTADKFLYLVEGAGHALRYGIGVAKPGFLWSGTHTITRMAEWPDWTPPAEMLGRRPDLPRHMDGGLANPLGARAMYLGSTLYRIHGTNEPDTIGTNVSSGCIRLRNEDVTDLYGRVRVGTRVVVM
ncbi:L,D-transpeptidase [Lichenibacterium minor]|uniref:L,D-transpeptidase n=1 Tax=Lichenibacterium minor TaxID=2316528 RepID=A0A4V1RV36_9HYPH|nr:L,D-transpeptidase [Lichenibacterium minor]RYC33284.1 L,D-transpeptidase [Lichenibacterium minor]